MRGHARSLGGFGRCWPDAGRLSDRHVHGDWGTIHPGDKGANEQALQDGDRIFSVYTTSKGVKLWVITEADRTSTCILLPDEY